MAQLTITIPNEQVQRVLDAFDARINGRRPGPRVPVGAEEVRQDILNYIKNVVRGHELEEARKAVVVSDVEPS